MPSPTKRVSRWLHNCSFSSSVSLLFVAILLISIVIAFLEFKSDRAIQKTSERQATFFKLNRHLANIGQEVQSIRGQQLHQKIHPGSVANDLSLRFLDFPSVLVRYQALSPNPVFLDSINPFFDFGKPLPGIRFPLRQSSPCNKSWDFLKRLALAPNCVEPEVVSTKALQPSNQ